MWWHTNPACSLEQFLELVDEFLLRHADKVITVIITQQACTFPELMTAIDGDLKCAQRLLSEDDSCKIYALLDDKSYCNSPACIIM